MLVKKPAFTENVNSMVQQAVGKNKFSKSFINLLTRHHVGKCHSYKKYYV